MGLEVMSFKGLLNHRCDIYDLVTSDDSGSPITSYMKINDKPVRCRLDLTFTRPGKDSNWMVAADRPDDRLGVMFLGKDAPIKVGVRIVMLRGPQGAFQIKSGIDEIWDYDSFSHYEVGVAEISSLQWRAPKTRNPED